MLKLVIVASFFSFSAFAQDVNLVRLSSGNFSSFDIAQSTCINEGTEIAPSFTVTNSIYLTNTSGESYTLEKKESGYGSCEWAYQASDKTSETFNDILFSIKMGDIEVVTVGTQNVCYRQVMNLLLNPDSTTVKSYNFKKLPTKCP
ncbi:MAG: hypothetical protein ACOYL6_15410 [Bacteriovoracaceae bacterium]